jgi:hypothetical protein
MKIFQLFFFILFFIQSIVCGMQPYDGNKPLLKQFLKRNALHLHPKNIFERIKTINPIANRIQAMVDNLGLVEFLGDVFKSHFFTLLSQDSHFLKTEAGISVWHTAVQKYAQCDWFEAFARQFLALGVDPDIPDSLGMYPLHYAVLAQNIPLTQMLVGLLANVHVQTYTDHKTPLHYACALGNEKIVLELLSSGAIPNTKDVFGATPLHYLMGRLCFMENDDVMSPLFSFNLDYLTDEMIASRLRILALLNKEGVDFNAVDTSYKTPYDYALDRNLCILIRVYDDLVSLRLQQYFASK